MTGPRPGEYLPWCKSMKGLFTRESKLLWPRLDVLNRVTAVCKTAYLSQDHCFGMTGPRPGEYLPWCKSMKGQFTREPKLLWPRLDALYCVTAVCKTAYLSQDHRFCMTGLRPGKCLPWCKSMKGPFTREPKLLCPRLDASYCVTAVCKTAYLSQDHRFGMTGPRPGEYLPWCKSMKGPFTRDPKLL